jgi:tetratricopeptide (TPR) repeat protein
MANEVGLKSPLVCRGDEMSVLMAALDSALAGHGRTVLVSGEAGIGKSRLCEEALAAAQSKGAAVSRGWCVEGTLEPLHPVREALEGLGSAHLLDDSPPPELLCLYLLDTGGLLVASAAKDAAAAGGAAPDGASASAIDADIFSGMLQAISNFAKDSLRPLGAGRSQLGNITYGEFAISIRGDSGFSLAAITRGRESEALLAEMDAILGEFAPRLAGWGGNVSEAEGAKSAMESAIRSGRYEGRHIVDDPGLRKNGLMSNVLAGLARKAAERPVVLYLDDLQWADPTTVSLLHYLARNIGSARILILGTYRPEDVAPGDGRPHPLASAMKTMSREGVLSSVALKRFGVDGSRELVESALGGSTLEEAFYSRLQSEGGGNPFYTIELLKLMTESGALARDGGGAWRLAKAVGELDMPERVADIVGRRLDRMAPEEARLLSVAAVLGDEFSLDALAGLTGMARLDLAGKLDAVESGTGLVRSSGAAYRFDHSKVREAAYARLGAGMRREIHRLAAESLLKDGASGKLSDVALHLYSAGDPRAADHLVAAARDARRRFAIEEGAKLFRLAAGIAPLGRDAAMEMAECERHVGQYDAAYALYSGLLDGADEKGRGVLLTLMADIRNLQAMWPEGVKLGEEAFALLEPAGASVELANVCHTMYHVNMRRGSMNDSELWAMRQMEMARGSGDDKALAQAEHDLGTLYLQTRRFDEALPHLEAAVSIRRNLGDLVGLGASLNNVGAIHHNRGAGEMAAGFYREALSIKRGTGDLRGIASTAVNLGIALKSRGDVKGAVRFMEESLSIRKRIGDITGQCICMNAIGLMWLEMHEVEKAKGCLATCLEFADRIGDRPGTGTTCANLGDLYLQLGNLGEAEKVLERGIALGEEMGDGLMRSLCRVSLAEVRVSAGRLDEADALLSRARAEAEEMKAEGLMGDYHRVAGLVAAARVDEASARAHFQSAVDIHARLRDGAPLAKARISYARFCRGLGDDAAADKLANEVVEYAKSMGAGRLLAAVEREHPGMRAK